SAGADPGPICYGRGGTRPTISDANLLLGRLDPSRLNAVEGGVRIEDVEAVFEAELGRPLGLTAAEAAAAVIRVANARMAGAIRMVSLSLGEDPRDFALFAFGGAGPLHAVALARELGVPRVLVPARPGITNALGCVVADIRHDFVNTVNRPLDGADLDEVHALFARRIDEGRALIAQESVEVERVEVVCSADMQFIGQTHLLRVALDGPEPSREDLQARFERAYWDRFRVSLPEIRPALVNLNVSVIGVRREIDLALLIDPAGRRASLAAAQVGARPVWFDAGWRDTPVYRREHLPEGAVIEGPAIVEQLDATLVIDPGCTARGDADGNLMIEIGDAA
ncbi:MAG: hydantoinase/oxoprolinase family protein, partial [Pseudomonadota bacterium]|nr:hydantoinase/oxoprolinase family protein [Pseudomonadota bacterium]